MSRDYIVDRWLLPSSRRKGIRSRAHPRRRRSECRSRCNLRTTAGFGAPPERITASLTGGGIQGDRPGSTRLAEP
jgi:hypothetical protein